MEVVHVLSYETIISKDGEDGWVVVKGSADLLIEGGEMKGVALVWQERSSRGERGPWKSSSFHWYFPIVLRGSNRGAIS